MSFNTADATDAASIRLWKAITSTILRDDPDATCDWFLGCYGVFGIDPNTKDEIRIAVSKAHHEQDWLPTRWEGIPVRIVHGGGGWHDL